MDVITDNNKFLVNTGDELVIDKKTLDLDSEYIFIPTTHNAPREVVDASAFLNGQERIVRMKMTKEGILIVEEDQDKRFKANEQNTSPVH